MHSSFMTVDLWIEELMRYILSDEDGALLMMVVENTVAVEEFSTMEEWIEGLFFAHSH